MLKAIVKPRVYLDTSVLSVYHDERSPERQEETRKFWARRAEFDLCTSTEAERELQRTPDPERRKQLLALLDSLIIHAVTDEMHEVAAAYIRAGIFSPAMGPDAIHVAVASVTRQDVLLSWNYRHLVNRQRRLWVATVNMSLGLPTPDLSLRRSCKRRLEHHEVLRLRECGP